MKRCSHHTLSEYKLSVPLLKHFCMTCLSAGNLMGMCMTNQAPKLRDLIYVNGLITSDLKM
jgi:hypothetical protein